MLGDVVVVLEMTDWSRSRLVSTLLLVCHLAKVLMFYQALNVSFKHLHVFTTFYITW